MNIYFDNYFLRFVANTIRALLDLLDEGDFSNAQGMKILFVTQFMIKRYLKRFLCLETMMIGKRLMNLWVRNI